MDLNSLKTKNDDLDTRLSTLESMDEIKHVYLKNIKEDILEVFSFVQDNAFHIGGKLPKVEVTRLEEIMDRFLNLAGRNSEFSNDIKNRSIVIPSTPAYREHNRLDHLDELSEVFVKYGEQDIRLGQAIYNVMRREKKDLYTIENDDLLKLLKEGL